MVRGSEHVRAGCQTASRPPIDKSLASLFSEMVNLFDRDDVDPDPVDEQTIIETVDSLTSEIVEALGDSEDNFHNTHHIDLGWAVERTSTPEHASKRS